MLHIKNRLNEGFDLLKLCSFTILCALFSIPIATFNPGLYENPVSAFFASVAFELFFLVIFVLPPALALMGIAYAVTGRQEKRMENVGYGYIAGFLVGLMLLLFIFRVPDLIGLAAIGFCVGLALSFVSIRRPVKAGLDSVVKGSILD